MDGAITVSTQLGGIFEGSLNQRSRRFECSLCIIGSPAVAVNIGWPIYGFSFSCIVGCLCNQPQSDQLSARCCSGSTLIIIRDCSYHPRAGSAMAIFSPRRRVIFSTSIPVVVQGVVRVGGKVRVVKLESVINDADSNTSACVVTPQGLYVHIDPCAAAIVSSVFQVPLVPVITC